MKLATRLLAAPLVAASVALGAGGLYAVITHQQHKARSEAADRELEDFKTIAQVQEQLGLVQAQAYKTMAIIESLDDAQTKAFVKTASDQIAGMQRTLASATASAAGDAELAQGLAAAAPLFEQYKKLLLKAIDLASVSANTAVGAMKGVDAAHESLVKTTRGVLARIETLQESNIKAANDRETRLALLLSLLGLGSTTAAVLWAWRAQRAIAADIGRAVQLSQRVAAGDLAADVQSTRRDEIGDLLRSLSSMVTGLRESLHTVKRASDNIATASVEIASGNLDLSQRTEQTASSLQHSASSVHQLTGTVQQSANSAAQANQLATSAADVAQRGGAVVAQVVSTMQDINTSSKKIADIIGTIDGIAFQTNILALNAAVEAARAGEQGRGFAVVASEVRSLAGRSANAAREIKSLIGASVEKVESGSRLVQDAGSTMNEIVASVQRVRDIISEISSAAGEQSQGISQVNTAVTQLDQMTQQNAALVEESAAAAESLKEQAATLRTVVGRFSLGATA